MGNVTSYGVKTEWEEVGERDGGVDGEFCVYAEVTEWKWLIWF